MTANVEWLLPTNRQSKGIPSHFSFFTLENQRYARWNVAPSPMRPHVEVVSICDEEALLPKELRDTRMSV